MLDAEMPSKRELPEELRPLTRRQAFRLTTHHWRHDVERLVQFFREVAGLEEEPAEEAEHRREEEKRKAEQAAAREARGRISPVLRDCGRGGVRYRSGSSDRPPAKVEIGDATLLRGTWQSSRATLSERPRTRRELLSGGP